MRTKAAKKTKLKSSILLIVCILAVGIFCYLGIFGAEGFGYRVKPFGEVISKGLDLQGGVSIVEEITDPKKPDQETINRTIKFLDLRVNKLGVSETTIRAEGNKIRIEIPGQSNAQDMIDTLTKTGKLTFKDPSNNVILTGDNIKKAQAGYDQNNSPIVSLQFDSNGSKKFSDATAKLVGQNISIYMDEDLIQSAQVNMQISGGNAQISNMKSIAEAQKTAALIQAGALPVTLKNVSTDTVGPTLGKEAIPQALKAGAIGLALVFLFMLINYRVPGLFASLALTVFILIVLSIFVMIGATLTLPGIAGFLLTVGMAVDANVLIFERAKEELRNGKSIRSSIEAGFSKAFASIIDSNITTVIAGSLLYILGSGTVRGFALTLIIGVLVSLFSAITVTRFLLKLGLNSGIMSKPWMLGVKGGK